MAYYRQDIQTHFNNNEPEVVPGDGYPERGVAWFKKNILPDFLGAIDGYNLSQDSLLDVGCAYGYFTVEYAKEFAHVTGVDFSDVRIAVAKMVNAEPNIDYQLKNLAQDQIEGKYDVAVSTAVYQHIDPENDRKAAFQATANALNDGGYLFLYDEDIITRNEIWNGFYEPLSEAWVRTNLEGIFELVDRTESAIVRGDHGEHIYRWVLKKI
jgi:2-polyprenyl-3-methyl-5-hydroxy-6-metoxy-1,4-benzoquinol methylase